MKPNEESVVRNVLMDACGDVHGARKFEEIAARIVAALDEDVVKTEHDFFDLIGADMTALGARRTWLELLSKLPWLTNTKENANEEATGEENEK